MTRLAKDEAFEQLVWVHPKTAGDRYWRVYVGEGLLAYMSPRQQDALRIQARIIDALRRSLKFQVMELAKENCDRCKNGEEVKKYKSRYGLRLMHRDRRIGWQLCDAERLWQALISDTGGEACGELAA